MKKPILPITGGHSATTARAQREKAAARLRDAHLHLHPPANGNRAARRKAAK